MTLIRDPRAVLEAHELTGPVPSVRTPSTIDDLMFPVPAGCADLIRDGELDELRRRLAGFVQLVDEAGFAILRGAPPADEETATSAALTIARLFGTPLEYMPELGVLNSGPTYPVVDRGFDVRSEDMLYSATSAALGLHTDGTEASFTPDHFLLLCVAQAETGGSSFACHIGNAYNRLLAADPDAARLLHRDFFREVVRVGRRDTVTDEEQLAHRWPILSSGMYGPGLTLRYTRRWVEEGHRLLGCPLEPDELRAIERWETELARDVIEFRLRPGDVLVADNHVVAHGRGSFQDAGRKRLLLRVWTRPAS